MISKERWNREAGVTAKKAEASSTEAGEFFV